MILEPGAPAGKVFLIIFGRVDIFSGGGKVVKKKPVKKTEVAEGKREEEIIGELEAGGQFGHEALSWNDNEVPLGYRAKSLVLTLQMDEGTYRSLWHGTFDDEEVKMVAYLKEMFRSLKLYDVSCIRTRLRRVDLPRGTLKYDDESSDDVLFIYSGDCHLMVLEKNEQRMRTYDVVANGTRLSMVGRCHAFGSFAGPELDRVLDDEAKLEKKGNDDDDTDDDDDDRRHRLQMLKKKKKKKPRRKPPLAEGDDEKLTDDLDEKLRSPKSRSYRLGLYCTTETTAFLCSASYLETHYPKLMRDLRNAVANIVRWSRDNVPQAIIDPEIPSSEKVGLSPRDRVVASSGRRRSLRATSTTAFTDGPLVPSTSVATMPPKRPRPPEDRVYTPGRAALPLRSFRTPPSSRYPTTMC